MDLIRDKEINGVEVVRDVERAITYMTEIYPIRKDISEDELKKITTLSALHGENHLIEFAKGTVLEYDYERNEAAEKNREVSQYVAVIDGHVISREGAKRMTSQWERISEDTDLDFNEWYKKYLSHHYAFIYKGTTNVTINL